MAESKIHVTLSPISPKATNEAASKTGNVNTTPIGNRTMNIGDRNDNIDIENASDAPYEKAKNNIEKTYTDEDRDYIADKTRGRSQTLIEDFNPDGYTNFYKNNLAYDDPKGNINAKNFADTLALSRQADARNNRLIRAPQDIGTFDGDNSIMPAQQKWEKLPQIETEEMRQMTTNRNIAANQRSHEEQLQSDIQRYRFELQKMSDSQQMQLLYTIGIDQHKLKDAFARAVMDIDYKMPATQKINFIFQRWIGDLSQWMNANVVNNLYSTFMKVSPLVAQIYTSVYGMGQLPTMEEALLNEMDGYVMQSDNTPTEKIAEMGMQRYFLSNLKAYLNGHSVGQGIRNTVSGYNKEADSPAK